MAPGVKRQVAVMQQPIENRCGEDLVAKHRAPLGDQLIRGDQQAATLVPA
jgi:hypothetical protein